MQVVVGQTTQVKLGVAVGKTYVKRITVGRPISAIQAKESLDSADVIAITGNIFLDSARTINLIDSAYIQARQVDLQRDSSFITSILDSSLGALTNSIIPHLDSSIDLGSSTKKFRTLFLSGGTIKLGSLSLSDSGGQFVARDSDLNKTKMDLSASSTTDLSEGDNLYYTRTRFDSAAISFIDSAYVQARQVDLQRDSSFITNIVDSAYVLARAPAQDFLDSSEAINLIDSAYVQARQIQYNTSNFTDSAFVTTQINNLIDGAPGTLDTLNEIAAALNDDDSAYNTLIGLIGAKSNLDSADAIQLIDSDYIISRINVNNLIDSAYVESVSLDSERTINLIRNDNLFIDSAYVESVSLDSERTINLIDSSYIQSRQALVDSASIISLVDSAYIQARQVDLQRDSGFITDIIDSDYVRSRQALVDSASIISLVDSSYVQSRQALVDSASIISLVDSDYVRSRQALVDSASIISLVDSDYVRSRQALVDSASIISLVDSDYIISRVNVDNLVDSAFVAAQIEASSLDSERTIALIDSAYVSIRSRELENFEFKYTLVDAGNATGPKIVLDRNSGSPTDSDALAQIEFRGRNDADSAISYAKIETFINDASADSEDAELHFTVTQSGIQRTKMKLAPTGIVLATNERIIFNGDSYQQALIPGAYTADHSLTLPDSTGTILTREFIETLIDSSYIQLRQDKSVATGLTLDIGDSTGAIILEVTVNQGAIIATGAPISFGTNITVLDKDSANVTIAL